MPSLDHTALVISWRLLSWGLPLRRPVRVQRGLPNIRLTLRIDLHRNPQYPAVKGIHCNIKNRFQIHVWTGPSHVQSQCGCMPSRSVATPLPSVCFRYPGDNPLPFVDTPLPSICFRHPSDIQLRIGGMPLPFACFRYPNDIGFGTMVSNQNTISQG